MYAKYMVDSAGMDFCSADDKEAVEVIFSQVPFLASICTPVYLCGV